MGDKYKELRELAQRATPGRWSMARGNGDGWPLIANPATITALLAERDSLLEALENACESIDLMQYEYNTCNGDLALETGRAAIEAAKRQEEGYERQ